MSDDAPHMVAFNPEGGTPTCLTCRAPMHKIGESYEPEEGHAYAMADPRLRAVMRWEVEWECPEGHRLRIGVPVPGPAVEPRCGPGPKQVHPR